MSEHCTKKNLPKRIELDEIALDIAGISDVRRCGEKLQALRVGIYIISLWSPSP